MEIYWARDPITIITPTISPPYAKTSASYWDISPQPSMWVTVDPANSKQSDNASAKMYHNGIIRILQPQLKLEMLRTSLTWGKMLRMHFVSIQEI